MRFGPVKNWVGKPVTEIGASTSPSAAPRMASHDAPSSDMGWDFSSSKPAPTPNATPQTPWPLARLNAVEALWGDGFTAPGGAPETLRLAKPLGLSSSASLILLGGGLGGPAQAIIDRFGAWVASFEADPDLCAVAVKRQPQIDPTNHMKVLGWDRHAPSFKRNCANHVMALEPLHGAPPAPVIESLTQALRPHGHIVLTELVADHPTNASDREFAAWCRLEMRDPPLPSTADVNRLLAKNHFDVRVVEDMSERHMAATLTGWRDAVRLMEIGPRPTARQAATLINEAELWLLRLRLMRRMGIKLVRWHAISVH